MVDASQTALQVYTAAYKIHPPGQDSFALLRKATRLDAVLPRQVVEAVPRRCVECDIDVSPRWHVVGDSEGMEVDGVQGRRTLCHQCWYQDMVVDVDDE